jgi:hypothetical protein
MVPDGLTPFLVPSTRIGLKNTHSNHELRITHTNCHCRVSVEIILMPSFISLALYHYLQMRVYFSSAFHSLADHTEYLEICSCMSLSDGTNLRSKRY